MFKRILAALLILSLSISMIHSSDLYIYADAEAHESDSYTTEGFSYTVLTDASVMIDRYAGVEKDVRIPDQLDGYPVTAIADSAFKGTYITSIVIPDSVIRIGKEAFRRCSNLTTITIGAGVTSIGNYAFADCKNVTQINYNAIDASENINGDSYSLFDYAGSNGTGIQVIIGDAVKVIPENLFWSEEYWWDTPPKITGVVIGENVQVIGKRAFAHCESLTDIVFDGDKLVTIEDEAFYDCSISTLSLPGNLTSIGSRAFIRCPIEKLVIPDSVTSIGSSAFYCETMKSVDTGNGISSLDGITFDSYKDIEEVIIGDSISEIPGSLFNNRTSLKTVVLGNQIETIGNYAFGNCPNITEISLPDSITKIGIGAFAACSLSGSLTIPENVSYIGNRAFMGNSFDKVFYHASKCYIGSNDERMDPESPEYFGKDSISIEPSVFPDCKEIIFADNVTFIPTALLADNVNITSVKLPENLRRIQPCAFRGCVNLKEIDIPESVVGIGADAFEACSNLTKVTIHGNTKSFGFDVFYGCDRLTIWCEAGSLAEKYAINNQIPYQYIEGYEPKPSELPEPMGTPATDYELRLGGVVSDNVSDNNYTRWTSVVNSYLFENADHMLTRVENMRDHVLIEVYDGETGVLKSSKSIVPELSSFGGFFNGSEYNYIVFGQTNYAENDGTEVLRIVKYSKTWERLDTASVYGANTYIPFDGGTLRMAEEDGKLYVYTCHEMYATEDDGLHHQANMIFVINEDDMSIADSYYDIANTSYGYVSHSFNQFIQTDENNIYRVDHGDGYPRGVSLMRSKIGNRITKVSDTISFSISGTVGNNNTGISVGGFALSTENCLIAGNSVPQLEAFIGFNVQRNVFLTVTDKLFSYTDKIWLTDYPEGSGIIVNTPQLVKLGEDQFLIMWEEVNDRVAITKMVTVDGDGNRTSGIAITDMRLSDCQPIVTSDGFVRWYQTDGEQATLYKVNPLNLSAYSVYTTDGFGYTILENGTVEINIYIGTETDVVIPDEIRGYPVAVIGESAFYNCSRITNIAIPETVTEIGADAFYGCKGLTDIEIPDGVTAIGSRAFSRCGIAELSLSENLTTIGTQAFSSCPIENLIIPDSVTSIGTGAFDSKTIKRVDTGNGISTLDGFNLRNSAVLEELIIGDSVIEIPDLFCYNAGALKTVVLGNQITHIGKNAFGDCSNLTGIIFPDSLTTIGDRAFNYCGLSGSLTIPENVSYIGDNAFFGNHIEKVVYDAVKCYIGYKDEELDPDSPIYDGGLGLTINKGVFPECKEIIFGDHVSIIPSFLVADNANITSVTLPENLRRIQPGAFRNCINLSEIDIPEGVTSIGISAFEYCSKLTKITILANVTNFGFTVFWGCKALTIWCEPDSAAERYAIANNIPYQYINEYTPSPSESPKPSESSQPGGTTPKPGETQRPAETEGSSEIPKPGSYLYGDMNGDSIIDANDALLILKIAAKLVTTSDGLKIIGDVDENGTLDASDALLVLKKAAKLIDHFPAEE